MWSSVTRPWRALSPITRGTLVAYVLCVGFSWAFRYAPGDTPLALRSVEPIDEPVIVVHFSPGGERALVALVGEPWSVLDWNRSAELAERPSLRALATSELEEVSAVQQSLFASGRWDVLGNDADRQATRVHHRFEGGAHEKVDAPPDTLWLTPSGELFRARDAFFERAEKELGTAPRTSPVWRTGRWAMLPAETTGELLLFDAESGAPQARIPAPKLREVFDPPRWSGFLFTYESGHHLRHVTCDTAGCEAGDVELSIDYAEITAADYHPEEERVAVCQGTSLWLYAGSPRDPFQLLGRGTLPDSCDDVWIASADTVLVQYEGLALAVAHFERP